MDLLGWFPLTQYGQMTPLAGDAFKDRLNTEAGEEELSLILGAADFSACFTGDSQGVREVTEGAGPA